MPKAKKTAAKPTPAKRPRVSGATKTPTPLPPLPKIPPAEPAPMTAEEAAAITCGGRHAAYKHSTKCRPGDSAKPVGIAPPVSAPVPSNVPGVSAPLAKPAPAARAFSTPEVKQDHATATASAYLEGPILEVSYSLMSQLASLQHRLAAYAHAGEEKGLVSWAAYSEALGSDFEDVFLKSRALSLIEKFAKTEAKKFKDDATMRMEIAGIVGDEQPGIAVGFMKLLHKTGTSAPTIDGQLVRTALLEQGVPSDVVEYCLAAGTKPGTPYGYIMPIDVGPKPPKESAEQ